MPETEALSTPAENEHALQALRERIASFTVGIAVANNTGIGTGTLVRDGDSRFILTAEHVVHDVDPAQIRFYCKPDAPLVPKAAREVTLGEIKSLDPGEIFPIQSIRSDVRRDIAILMLPPDFSPPGAAQYYDLSNSREIGSSSLAGVSLLCVGFPTANSRIVTMTNKRAFKFLGVASHICYFDSELNSTVWKRLPSKFSPDENFVMSYDGIGEDIDPYGFSGCGVWIPAAREERVLWQADPILVGVVHDYVRNLSILIATALQSVLSTIDALIGEK